MKNIKKLVGLALALALALSLAIPAAFAAPGDSTPSITITNAVEGQTYTVYKLFDLKSYTDKGPGNYAYTITAGVNPWYEFFSEGDGAEYITLTPAGDDGKGNPVYAVAWNEDKGTDEGTAQILAQKALSYVETSGKDFAISGSKKATADGPLTITLETLGYYLVDSSLGAMCSLDTANPQVDMEDKNAKPSVIKEVQEDSNGNWGDANTADIGQVVNYRTTITAQRGGEDYILHDRMSDGLTFNSDVKVFVGETEVAVENYTVAAGDEAENACTFHVTFTDAFIQGLDYDKSEGGVQIVVTYSATLNADAVIFDANTNTTFLQYGNEVTPDATTNTFTFSFGLVKTNDKDVLLDGATFRLYRDGAGTDEVPLVLDNGVYRLAKEGETAVEITAGNVIVEGLDEGKYYLKETKAPDGYNKLNDLKEVSLSRADGNLREVSIIENGGVADDGTTPADTYDEGGVQVVNKSGTLLPSTGGIGTTIFYIGGGILAVGAVILLIVRRRMRVDAE